jgi:hypothetical protein
MSIKHLYLLAAAAVCACTTPGKAPQDVSVPPANSTRKTNFLTFDEIAAAHADAGTVYVAISRLRPNWLAAHGVAGQGPGGMEYASVYVDGQQVGDPSTLKNIQAYHVGDVTYYDVTQAGARFGVRAGMGGVIDVRLKGSK